MLAGYGDFGAMQRIAYAAGAFGSFLNIPQTFQDLMIVCFQRGVYNNTLEYTGLFFNNEGAGNYSSTYILGNGSSASSSRWTNMGYTSQNIIAAAQNTAGVYSSLTYHILNYKNTSTFKTVISRVANDQNGAGTVSHTVSLWRNTAAISRIDIAMANFENASNSTFALYGVKASAV